MSNFLSPNDYEIFKKFMTTVKCTSKDSEHNEYMTECTAPAVNFDKVVKSYCKNICISTVGSNDALVFHPNDTVTFIEFKNGHINNPEQQRKLLKKIYDSIVIFTDITGKTISDTRNFLNYILVYNERKNPDNTNPKIKYRASKSRDEIDKILLGYGKETHIKYGLEFLKGYCFKEVNTYTQNEFEELYIKKLKKAQKRRNNYGI